MKDINEMSYEELLDIEKLVESAKSKFYGVDNLYVFGGHICSKKVAGNYSFLGSRTPVDYYDFFSGSFIGRNTIFSEIPSLKHVLDDNNIPYKEYMSSSEIKEIWEQYKKQTKVYKKNKIE